MIFIFLIFIKLPQVLPLNYLDLNYKNVLEPRQATYNLETFVRKEGSRYDPTNLRQLYKLLLAQNDMGNALNAQRPNIKSYNDIHMPMHCDYRNQLTEKKPYFNSLDNNWRRKTASNLILPVDRSPIFLAASESAHNQQQLNTNQKEILLNGLVRKREAKQIGKHNFTVNDINIFYNSLTSLLDSLNIDLLEALKSNIDEKLNRNVQNMPPVETDKKKKEHTEIFSCQNSTCTSCNKTTHKIKYNEENLADPHYKDNCLKNLTPKSQELVSEQMSTRNSIDKPTVIFVESTDSINIPNERAEQIHDQPEVKLKNIKVKFKLRPVARMDNTLSKNFMEEFPEEVKQDKKKQKDRHFSSESSSAEKNILINNVNQVACSLSKEFLRKVLPSIPKDELMDLFRTEHDQTNIIDTLLDRIFDKALVSADHSVSGTFETDEKEKEFLIVSTDSVKEELLNTQNILKDSGKFMYPLIHESGLKPKLIKPDNIRKPLATDIGYFYRFSGRSESPKQFDGETVNIDTYDEENEEAYEEDDSNNETNQNEFLEDYALKKAHSKQVKKHIKNNNIISLLKGNSNGSEQGSLYGNDRQI